jgi:DNA recombination protein RmuC
VLGEAKAEFKKYADVWEKVSGQLRTAQNSIEEISVRARAVEKRLKDVEVNDNSAVVEADPALALAPSREPGDEPRTLLS